MKKYSLIGCLFLTGCAGMRHNFTPILPTHAETACHRFNYCSETSGAVVIGSTVCYTDHAEQGINATDLRCE